MAHRNAEGGNDESTKHQARQRREHGQRYPQSNPPALLGGGEDPGRP